MAFPFPQYVKIKDRYCIYYAGSNDEYVFQLLYLKPYIEQELSGIEIWICCKQHLSYLVENQKRIIFTSEIQTHKYDFAYIRDLKNNQIIHPIYELLEESKLLLPTLEFPKSINQNLKTCIICSQGHAPTKSLTENQITKIKKIIQNKGYEISTNQNVEQCGWVIGVESLPLFKAATLGIKTTLISTGVGDKLYEKLFPKEEILKLDS